MLLSVCSTFCRHLSRNVVTCLVQPALRPKILNKLNKRWISHSYVSSQHILNYGRQQPPWRTMFFGTDEFALQHLKALTENQKLDNGQVVDFVEVVVPKCKCIVRDYAQASGLTVHEWSAKSVQEMVTSRQFDVGIIVSFGHLIPGSIINAFPYGILNVHPSILPRWRGAAPILHTILNGDRETGISIMEIRPINFDVGPLLVQVKYPVPENCTSFQLRDYLALEGSQLLLSTLRDLKCLEKIEYEQNSEGVTHAPKLKSISSHINWRQQTVEDIDRQYRALGEIFGMRTKWNDKSVRLLDMVPLIEMQVEDIELSLSTADLTPPGTAVYCQSRELICIRCRDGWVAFREIVYKKPMTAKSFYNGYLSKLENSRTTFKSEENHLFRSYSPIKWPEMDRIPRFGSIRG